MNIDLDRDDRRHPDIIADARQLPFPDAAFTRVYCGHVLEHIPEPDVPTVLREIKRVLAPAGRLLIVGPALELAVDEPTRHGIIDGAGRWDGDRHQWTPTAATTLNLVRTVFPHARPVPLDAITGDWPLVSRAGWQCAVTAMNRCTDRGGAGDEAVTAGSAESWPASALRAALREFNSAPPVPARKMGWRPRELTGSTPEPDEE